jgi:hypothetical protein
LAAARRLRAFLNVAANLRKKACGEIEDWKAIVTDPTKLEEGWVGNLAFERTQITYAVNMLANFSWVRLALRWEGETPEVKVGAGSPWGGSTLFATLTAQVLIAMSSQGLAFCSRCGSPFLPVRAPVALGRTFCDDCGRPAATQAAMRDYRERIREAKSMADAGVPVRTIARRMNRSEDKIRRWLGPRRLSRIPEPTHP